jgi:four helix bundle protein
MKFAYEDLDVWNKSVEFAIEIINIVEKINTDRKHYRLLEQVESSSTSIAMNIVAPPRRCWGLRPVSV